MSIVVTAATGKLGRLVVEELLAKVPADQVVAVVRNPAAAAGLADRGVTVRTADYNDPQSLKEAFRGGDRVLLISGNEMGRRVAQHTAVVRAAAAAGVAQFAYTGILGGPDADFDLADEHKATEQAVLDSGVPYTFLRNGWYSENYTENLGPVLEHGAVLSSAGEGRVASAARADYAAAAAAVLTGEGHLGRAYELSGDVAWSLDEYAAEVGRQSGKPVVHRSLPPAEHQAVLVDAGVPAPVAAALVGVDVAAARGVLSGTSGELRRLIGRPTTPIAESIAVALRVR
ncbi:NAD(P)H-binding protein [Streptomyces sp. I05A-00742]|uniref:NAD(P)H-binding protein n=1 Tax=Streptomyces sp. I05A-00742 TaxID=2732853 RepID=UPI0014887FA6|nr:NAD(P)H-binding protein [Streptomyces sp. I05A-00742]